MSENSSSYFMTNCSLGFVNGWRDFCVSFGDEEDLRWSFAVYFKLTRRRATGRHHLRADVQVARRSLLRSNGDESWEKSESASAARYGGTTRRMGENILYRFEGEPIETLGRVATFTDNMAAPRTCGLQGFILLPKLRPILELLMAQDRNRSSRRRSRPAANASSSEVKH